MSKIEIPGPEHGCHCANCAKWETCAACHAERMVWARKLAEREISNDSTEAIAKVVNDPTPYI